MLYVFRVDLARLAGNLNDWSPAEGFDIAAARIWLTSRVEDEPSPFRLFAWPDLFISDEDPRLYLSTEEILSSESLPT